MTNKEIKEAIFKELKERQIEVINPSVGNGYYLFDFGEESVVHFHIKGCKRWLWGIWITHDENKTNINLFGEHEDYIDKFKPTQTAIAVKTEIPDDASEEQWEDEINNVVWDLCYEKLFIVHSSNIAGKMRIGKSCAMVSITMVVL